MKNLLKAFGMCQSMFCAIPCPWHGWDENLRDRMLLCLPLIGLEIGAIWYLIARVLFWLPVPELLRAAGICAAPWLLTGFMHLDGFMDVTDAVRSWRSPERRREILKDSHVGSFSVIGFGLVLLLQFAAAASIREPAGLELLILLPAVSRCCSILAIRLLPPMASSQYSRQEKKLSGILIPPAFLIAAIAAAAFMNVYALLPLAGELLVFLLCLLRAYRSLEGMNGDISGYCITLSELGGLILLALNL